MISSLAIFMVTHESNSLELLTSRSSGKYCLMPGMEVIPHAAIFASCNKNDQGMRCNNIVPPGGLLCESIKAIRPGQYQGMTGITTKGMASEDNPNRYLALFTNLDFMNQI